MNETNTNTNPKMKTNAAGESNPGAEGEEMEVKVNGNSGSALKFRIGFTVLVQIVAMCIAFGASYTVLRAEVDDLKVRTEKSVAQNESIIKELVRTQTTVEHLAEEIRYLRDDVIVRHGGAAPRR